MHAVALLHFLEQEDSMNGSAMRTRWMAAALASLAFALAAYSIHTPAREHALAVSDAAGTTAPALVNVDATASGGSVLVTWTAEGERDILIYQVQVSRDGDSFHPVGSPLPVSGEGSPYAVAFALGRGDHPPCVRVRALLPDGSSLTSTVLRVRENTPNLGGRAIRRTGPLAAGPDWEPAEHARAPFRAGTEDGVTSPAQHDGSPWAPPSPGGSPVKVLEPLAGGTGDGRTWEAGNREPRVHRATLDGHRLTVFWAPQDEKELPREVNLKVASGQPRRFRMVAKGLTPVPLDEGFAVHLEEGDFDEDLADPLFVRVEAVLDGDEQVLSEPIQVSRL